MPYSKGNLRPMHADASLPYVIWILNIQFSQKMSGRV